MATVLNTIYPPQIETFMPSFCYNEPAKIWFNISSYNEDITSKIKFIHISMVDQYNNATVFAGINSGETVYPQYYPLAFDINSSKVGYDLDKKMYWAIVPPQVLKTSPYYDIGQYYKIQIRFDLTGSGGYNAYSTEYNDPTKFFHWNSDNSETNALGLALYTNYNQDNFSEWSRSALIKPILIPELSIQSFTSSLTNINPSTDTSIVGNLTFKKDSEDDANRNEDEQLSWYQIKIYSNNKKIEYFSSDKIYSKNNEIKYRLDTSFLTINTQYKIQIIYETNNGYTTSKFYSIKIIKYSTVDNNVQCSKSIDEEKGTVTLNITWPGLNDTTSGYLVVRRASHKTNFSQWELLIAKNISELSELTVVDNTLESLTGYRYQIQYITNSEMYPPVYVENNDIIHCDFYGNLFSDSKKTLKISFNFQLTNQTNAVNRTKIDTLGGQYPLFVQNAKLKYHTYTISGRISTEDDGELFLPKQEVFGNKYYNYRYNPNTTSPHTSECQSIKSNNDWLYEREYRNAVEEWLNNGKPKLFRSMTEGNIVVMLDGISMTPDTVLGRRLYDFNATMYEIGDGENIESLASFGLFDIIDER